MNVEFLNSVGGSPTIRIQGTDAYQLGELLSRIRALARGSLDQTTIEDLTSERSLQLELAAIDDVRAIGVARIESGFRWCLTRPFWDDVAELMDPVCGYAGDRSSSQWLMGGQARSQWQRSAIGLLLTNDPNGHW